LSLFNQEYSFKSIFQNIGRTRLEMQRPTKGSMIPLIEEDDVMKQMRWLIL